MKMFSIRDSKAEAYLLPIFAPTVGVAIRIFQNAATKEGTDFYKYAADYTLFEVGVWDETKGIPDKLAGGNRNIVNGLDVKEMTIRGGE